MPVKSKEETSIAVTPTPQVTADEVRKFIVGQKTFDKVSPQQIDMAIETAKAYNLIRYRTENLFAIGRRVGGSSGNRKLTGTRIPSRSA